MNEKPKVAPDEVPDGVVVNDYPTGFSPELLARQPEIARRLDEITGDPEVLRRSERFHERVTRINFEARYRQLT